MCEYPNHSLSQTQIDFLTEIPKCEHHLHIEGTLEPKLLFQLAGKNNITLPDTFPKTHEELAESYNHFSNLQDFLDVYYIGCNVLITEDDFYLLALEYLTKVSKQGLKHTEIFFDPQSHTSRNLSIDLVFNGLQRACQQIQKECGITTKIIMCLLRHLPTDDCSKTIDQASHLIKSGEIHGIGLDSSEKPFPPEIFDDVYKKAKNLNENLRLTAHAGEEGDASYITNALDVLQVERIDHGVRSIEDPRVIERLASTQTMLSVCPLSNVVLRVVKNVSELPIKKFLDAGVSFSINSDDPAYFGGYILDNYLEVQRRFNLSKQDWKKIVTNSIKGSWCDNTRKTELFNELDLVLKKYDDF
ncbi:probable Adenine deaminase [Hanseniaspora guilliermondii]|uniref:Adenine deaminase n=1 Tax=Hanseniaspora guilliermondii TaxID=56406 RepID=A0A1L0FFU6_9ASCO|nr:probable Adenine deaminase [Hanseniaspora guilliermondii]